ALEAGEVDLIAANNFIKKDNYKMVGVYGITPVFALSKKGEPFVKELDRAIQGIKINSPNFEDDLYEKYYGQKVNFIASGFTREESKYIATLGNIKVGVFDHFSPLSYLDSKGKFVGVYIDILDQLSSVSGICFEPIALDPEMDTAQALESGKCDIIMGVNSQLGDTYPSMALSNYFMVSETSAVGRIDTEHDFNQALDIVLLRNLSGSAVSKAKLNSAIHFTFAHSPKECLLMVEKGDTDISILNSYVANYHLKNPRFNALQTKPTLSYSSYDCMAVRHDDRLLLSILNKIIPLIDEDKVSTSIREHINQRDADITLCDFLYPARDAIYLVAALFIICIVLIAGLNINKKRQVESKKSLKEIKKQRDSSLLNYNALLQNIPGGVAIYEVFDDRLSLKFFNDAVCEILECNRLSYETNANVKAFWCLFAQDRIRLLELIRTSFASSSRFTGIYRVAREDCSFKWIKINGSITKDEGQPPLLHIVYLDVDREIATNLALEKSNTLIKSMLDFSPAGIFRVADGGDGALDFVSENTMKMLGYTEEEFLNKFRNNFYHLVYKDDVSRVTVELQRQMATSSPMTSCEFRIETKSGELRWFYDEGRRMLDENGVSWFYIIIIDITLQKQSEQIREKATLELKHAAEYDHLTDIYNAQTFYGQVEEMLASVQEKYVLVRLNISKFKLINDLFGTNTGDSVLVAISKCLKKFYEPIGRIGRLGSDHFACCLPKKDFNPLLFIFRLNEFFDILNINYPITPKLGIYEIEDTHLPVVYMCDRAILALQTINSDYLADFAYYDDTLRQEMMDEQVITSEMNFALEDKQFVVFLQPIFSLSQNKPVSAEALVRWIHPEKGIIPPGAFIPIFEKTGFIARLDYYVFEETCRLLHQRRADGKAMLPISVNVSRRSLYNPNLCEDILDILEHYNLEPSYIRIEITESAYMDNSELLLSTIIKLRSNGFVVLMDDFGSGYSSFNALKDIPVDILKIDMDFMSDIDSSRKGANILKSIINMATLINIDTVAEGVETLAQLNFLKDIGCDKIQGYYFSKPLPIDKFEEYVAAKE
ncbi:MAG: EAL domain-containing protein, partial [Oscillospiraceae bacterium]